MSKNPKRRYQAWLVVATLVSIASLSGCGKAKTIQAGATQFEAESLAAIELIDEFRRAETSVTPPTPAEAQDKFVSLVSNSSAPVTLTTLKLLEAPFALELARSEPAWQAFLSGLRKHHIEFTKIYSSLDDGSLFAGPAVKESANSIEPLISQLTAFAKHIAEKPVVFTRERAALATDIESIRDDNSLSAKQKRAALIVASVRLQTLGASEAELTKQALAQSLKAAQVGMALKELLIEYDQLTIGDIADGLTAAFNLASVIPGLDIGGLKADTGKLIEEIQKDPALAALLEKGLGELTMARPTN